MTQPTQPSANDNAGYSDEQLLTHAKEGSKKHFRMLVQRHLDRVWRVAFRVVKDASEAEDITQEVFVILWQKRAELVPEKGSIGSWLYKVAFNRALDFKRVQKRATHVELDEENTPRIAASQHRNMEYRQQSDAVWQHLSSLPENQRHALVLYYFEELSVEEISARMGTTEMGVRSLLKRGKQQLRGNLAQELLNDTP